jgi:hypothetical protein
MRSLKIAKCRGDGTKPAEAWVVGGKDVLPLEQHVLPSREALQGRLGYKNHPMLLNAQVKASTIAVYQVY